MSFFISFSFFFFSTTPFVFHPFTVRWGELGSREPAETQTHSVWPIWSFRLSQNNQRGNLTPSSPLFLVSPSGIPLGQEAPRNTNCYSEVSFTKGPLDKVPPRGPFKFIESVKSTSLSIVAILALWLTRTMQATFTISCGSNTWVLGSRKHQRSVLVLHLLISISLTLSITTIYLHIFNGRWTMVISIHCTINQIRAIIVNQGK